MSFESLMDITKNVPSLGTLIAFIGINKLFEFFDLFIKFLNILVCIHHLFDSNKSVGIYRVILANILSLSQNFSGLSE